MKHCQIKDINYNQTILRAIQDSTVTKQTGHKTAKIKQERHIEKEMVPHLIFKM